MALPTRAAGTRPVARRVQKAIDKREAFAKDRERSPPGRLNRFISGHDYGDGRPHTARDEPSHSSTSCSGRAESGPIPDGQAKGTAIVAPGTVFSPEVAEAVNLFAWQGKTFDGPHGVLRNRISVLGLNAIVAEVYKGPSLARQKECIVLDYSKTSTVAEWIRDEIRLLEPGTYLGEVYWEQEAGAPFRAAVRLIRSGEQRR